MLARVYVFVCNVYVLTQECACICASEYVSARVRARVYVRVCKLARMCFANM